MLINRWEPENRAFWEREGSRVARRNLAHSVPALVVAFAVWMVWSAVAVELPHIGFRFTPNQLFWLAAAPALAGGVLRLFFAFLVPIVGGRRWTAISTALLAVPMLGLGIAVQDLGTSYPTFLALALAAGIGGGNFASSTANVSLFYPLERKGFALGLNAGIGNLGVGLAQLVTPLVASVALFGTLAGAAQMWSDGETARAVWLQNAGFVWVPIAIGLAITAWLRMDDLAPIEASIADQAVVFIRKDTWVLSWLYLGTFGSFIGFAAGLPLLADMAFPSGHVLGYAFLGPLAAAAARPAGGWLAGRLGGAPVALCAFALLAAGTAALHLAMPTVPGTGSYAGFLAIATVLFVASGLGNGAVFHMVPAVFAQRHRRASVATGTQASTERTGVIEGAAALGFCSAIAAFGGFVIPKSLGTATAVTGSTSPALYLFLVFYASCLAATWWFYARRGAEVRC
jgi:NNP family nitrate/nitrite transporter-like MFS transporter